MERESVFPPIFEGRVCQYQLVIIRDAEDRRICPAMKLAKRPPSHLMQCLRWSESGRPLLRETKKKHFGGIKTEVDPVSLVQCAILGLHLDDQLRRDYLRARWTSSESRVTKSAKESM
jgi:hypothetical protein